jgi:hypothetical protein
MSTTDITRPAIAPDAYLFTVDQLRPLVVSNRIPGRSPRRRLRLCERGTLFPFIDGTAFFHDCRSRPNYLVPPR